MFHVSSLFLLPPPFFLFLAFLGIPLAAVASRDTYVRYISRLQFVLYDSFVEQVHSAHYRRSTAGRFLHSRLVVWARPMFPDAVSNDKLIVFVIVVWNYFGDDGVLLTIVQWFVSITPSQLT